MNASNEQLEMEGRARLHPDLRLMELAERSPSPGGRELLREIIERGAHPLPNQPAPARDLVAALHPRPLDDADYRAPVEQASQLHQASPALRDLYERGATRKGDMLILPAEAHELAEERAQPFLTTLAYAQQKLADRELAKEFYELARTISGTTADARTELTVFKIYYDRLDRAENGRLLEKSDADGQQKAVTRTLTEMRALALEMAQFETRESLEIEPTAAREFTDNNRALNVTARTVDLRGEALRWPAGLSHATKERLLTHTLPELDYRLERGVPRVELFRAIDRSMARPDTEVNQEQRSEIGGFLKAYLYERLRDPETRAAHTSPAFRQAREAFAQARTTEEVSRVADEFWRTNRKRSEAQWLHQADPANHPPPVVKPLDARERNLLFYGRAPAHYTAEMRELRIEYGFNQAERAERVAQLQRGELEPSPPLQQLLDELARRRTVKAVSHFQASLLNEQVKAPNRLNLYVLREQLPPYEKTYLLQATEARKQSFQPPQRAPVLTQSQSQRGFGELPRHSGSLRAYLAHLGRIERELLNDAVMRRDPDQSNRELLTITDARQRLPETVHQEVRRQASQLAWEQMIPAEAKEAQPIGAVQRVVDTVGWLRDELQANARLAESARDNRNESAKLHEATNSRQTSQLAQAADRFAAEAREALYRGFELLDERLEFLHEVRKANAIRPLPGAALSQGVEHQHRSTGLPVSESNSNWHFDNLSEALDHRRFTAPASMTLEFTQSPQITHDLER